MTMCSLLEAGITCYSVNYQQQNGATLINFPKIIERQVANAYLRPGGSNTYDWMLGERLT